MKYRLTFMVSTWLLTACSIAYALDAGDIGEYAVVHVDGHVTNKVFRVIRNDNGWQVEDRKPDGSWHNVTCQADCILTESKQNEVEYFMGGKTPEGMSANCVHNQAFAFCSITKASDIERKYLLVVHVQNKAVPIKLVKLDRE